MWVEAGTENQCRVWDCCLERKVTSQAHQQFQELTQIFKTFQIFNASQAGCVNSSGRAVARRPHAPAPDRKWVLIFFLWRKNFIYQPCSCTASTPEECYCAVCIASAQRLYRARDFFFLLYIKASQRQCCLLVHFGTTAELVSASAQCSYSAGKRPQEGRTINTVLITFKLALDSLKSHLQMLKRLLFACFGQPSCPKSYHNGFILMRGMPWHLSPSVRVTICELMGIYKRVDSTFHWVCDEKGLFCDGSSRLTMEVHILVEEI